MKTQRIETIGTNLRPRTHASEAALLEQLALHRLKRIRARRLLHPVLNALALAASAFRPIRRLQKVGPDHRHLEPHQFESLELARQRLLRNFL